MLVAAIRPDKLRLIPKSRRVRAAAGLQKQTQVVLGGKADVRAPHGKRLQRMGAKRPRRDDVVPTISWLAVIDTRVSPLPKRLSA